MDTLRKIQDWYAKQCNGEWEHGWGIKIDTIDNPGWTVDIELTQTKYEKLEFPRIERGDIAANVDWIRCWSKDAVFSGIGDPSKLEEILGYFLSCVEKHDAK